MVVVGGGTNVRCVVVVVVVVVTGSGVAHPLNADNRMIARAALQKIFQCFIGEFLSFLIRVRGQNRLY